MANFYRLSVAILLLYSDPHPTFENKKKKSALPNWLVQWSFRPDSTCWKFKAKEVRKKDDKCSNGTSGGGEPRDHLLVHTVLIIPTFESLQTNFPLVFIFTSCFPNTKLRSFV